MNFMYCTTVVIKVMLGKINKTIQTIMPTGGYQAGIL